jgi:acyl-coenzyme A synthetase/AMP-(fatty) acid ligase
MALHGPCAFAAEHPLHPDEVLALAAQVGGRRVLITAPVHLRALAESAQSMPVLDRVVSATAPLALELAQRCESMWSTRVFEVYGCTETGMVATRRTVEGPIWTTMRDVKVESRGGEFHAYGGHVQPGPLADRLRLISASTFELEGRAGDVVNIGGKRASLEGLNRLLLSIDGVVDGAIFEPPAMADSAREQRLMGLVVAPAITRAELLASLRAQIDAAFLPRPLLRVDSLPRNAQGKLPRAELLALAEKMLRATRRQPKASRTVAQAGDARID